MVSQHDHSSSGSPALGTLVQGRFRLTRELAHGPVSRVYAGLDHHQGDEVVLKVLDIPAAERARVRHEVMAAWEVAHDRIVPVRGCFEEGERCWVVTPYVAGPDLRTAAALSPFTPDEAAAVGRGIALGLQAAHRRGLLHRHVKPGNILVEPDVRARLVDFGSGGFGVPRGLGPQDFSAPEVLAGQPADARADLYGLGMSLYFALTADLPPRQAADRPPMAVADGHRASQLRTAIPHWLDDAVAKATAALPADRFSSAGRLAEALAPAGARRAGALTR